MTQPPPSDEGVIELRKERQEFIERVRVNERLAAADPEGYRRKLRNLVALGYAYIGGMLFLAIILFAAVVGLMVFGHRISGAAIKIALVLGFFLFAILRSLWVKIDPPEGLLVDRERAPRLWRETEAIADRLGAPHPDEIRLDEAFNASAAQIPRFGMFGGYRSVLTLGMPLLASLDHDEAVAVIAHEFGHFSGKHGRFGVWVYRVYQTWAQLGANLGNGNSAGLFRPFVNWFFPRFSATSFVLRRQHEYEADRAAAEIVGAPVVARMLARLGVLGEHQQRAFWAPLERAMEHVGNPAAGFFSKLPETIRQPLDPSATERRLAFALAEATDYDDSHPSLTDRLASLGQSAPAPITELPAVSAAETFFGEGLPGLLRDLENDYATRMAPFWAMLGERREKMKERLATLEKTATERALTEDEAVETAFLRAQGQEPEAAIDVFRELHAAYPENASAAYFLGERLAESDDPAGAELLRFAAERDPEWADAVRQALASYLARQGDHDSFSALREEAIEAHDRQAVAEGASIPTLKDEFLPPDLSPDERTRLRQALSAFKGLARVYAFRKRLPGTGEIRDYLFFVAKAATFTNDEPLAYFTKQFNDETDLVRPFILLAYPSPKAWAKRFETLEGAVVFDYKEK